MNANRRFIFVLVCMASTLTSFCQERLTIEECYERALANYPLIRQYNLIAASREYNLSNAGKSYLPQLALNAKASWQTDVTTLNLNIPGVDLSGLGIPKLSKDQYSATVDINQNIWDGGTTAANKKIIRSSSEADMRELDTQLYPIHDRINQLFFGVLLLDTRLKQNELLREDLKRNRHTISSYMENGVASQADLDAVEVEEIKTVQNEINLRATRQGYLDMLSLLIGEYLPPDVVLIKPNAEDEMISLEINRPELRLFQAQYTQLETRKELLRTNYRPRLALYGTGGYGRPGLNMLDNDFSPYFLGGIRLSWNFSALYTRKNDFRLIESSQSSIQVQQETFLFNTRLETLREIQEVRKYQDMLKYDDRIVILRKNVREAAEARLAEGIITVTDLLREVTQEDSARQDQIEHETQLLLSIYNLKYQTNN